MVIRQIHAYLRKFLWSGSFTNARAKVHSSNVFVPKNVGRLNLIDIEDMVDALMAKWIVKALGLGSYTLQIYLCYRL